MCLDCAQLEVLDVPGHAAYVPQAQTKSFIGVAGKFDCAAGISISRRQSNTQRAGESCARPLAKGHGQIHERERTGHEKNSVQCYRSTIAVAPRALSS